MYIEEFTNLTLSYLDDKDWREMYHQGYQFIIQDNYTAHSAHHTLVGLTSWMRFRGLKFGNPVNINMAKNSVRLVPGFRRISTMSLKFFDMCRELYPDVVPILSNGRYTEALRIPPIESDDLVSLLYLNVNIKRKESHNMYDKDLVKGLFEGIYG